MNFKLPISEFEKWEDILEKEWLWLLPDEKENWIWLDSNWEKAVNACKWECTDCIDTFIWEDKIRINVILCCPYHPETREISEQWYCPEVNLETGLCNVYETDEYPWQCKWYHCKKDWR